MSGIETTHEVTNQPPPLDDLNLYETYPVLVEGLKREGAAWVRPPTVPTFAGTQRPRD